MKISITSQQYNPLLRRKEVAFELGHEDMKGTPSRLEVRKALSEVIKANIEMVYIKKIQTKTGTMKAKGEANIYDTAEQAKLVESKYVIERNIPSEKKPKEEATPTEAPAAEKEKKEEKKAEKKEQ